MPQKQISPYAQTLLDAWSILLQNKTDKPKIYSLHEPQVSCISKGKAHTPFEFGSKVSISRTRDSGIILGALALPGNPYDGHTIQDTLKQIKRIIGKQLEILIADRGYKGQKEFDKNPFADSFSSSKNRLSIRSAQAKDQIPQKSRAGSDHQSLKTAFSNGEMLPQG